MSIMHNGEKVLNNINTASITQTIDSTSTEKDIPSAKVVNDKITEIKVYYDLVQINLSLVVPNSGSTTFENIATYVPSDRKLLCILGCDIWGHANDVIPTVISNTILRFKNLKASNVTLSTIAIPYLYTTA